MDDSTRSPELALHIQLEDHARSMYLAGFYKDARTAIERSIPLCPECYDALILLASILFALDLDDEGLAVYDRCIALFPGNPEAYADKADALCIRRKYDEAESLARQALSLHRTYQYEDDFEDEADGANERDRQREIIYTTIAGILQARGSLREAFELVAEAERAGVERASFQFLNRPLLRSV